MAEKCAEYQENYNRRPPSKRGVWKSELLGWEFVHEASRLDSGNRILAPDVARADFGAEVSRGTVAADSVTDPSKTINGGLAAVSSAGTEAPLAQLNICSSVQMAVSGVEVSGATVTENSGIDLSEPSNEALVSGPPRDLTAQTIASDVRGDCSMAAVGVLHEGQRYDNIVGLHGEPSPQPDPTSSSQPVALTEEGQERKNDSSAADLEACTSAHNVALLLDSQGEVGNTSASKAECVSD